MATKRWIKYRKYLTNFSAIEIFRQITEKVLVNYMRWKENGVMKMSKHMKGNH